MRKRDEAPGRRFGAGRWVSLLTTGEHVRVEVWSPLASAYRVRSRKSGLQFIPEADLLDLPPHPEAHLGKYWSRCPVLRCHAPLTPGLAICPDCKVAICTCGRCRCAQPRARRAAAKSLAAPPKPTGDGPPA